MRLSSGLYTPEIIRPPSPVVNGALADLRRRERARWRRIYDPRITWRTAPTFDANATAPVNSNGATTLSNTALTVGSGSNRLLLVMMSFGGDPGTISACNWDDAGTPQACTSLVSAVSGAGSKYAKMYYLFAPTSGNKTLKATWTNSVPCILTACAFADVDQTGGATTFPTTPTTSTAGTSITLNITSASGRMTVASVAGGSGDIQSVDTQTSLGKQSTNNSGGQWGGSYGAGSASNAHTFSFQITQMVAVGCDIVGAGGGGGGRTTKNTRAFPLGTEIGMHWGGLV